MFRVWLWGILLANTLYGGDWAQWRGPGRDGQVSGAVLPTTWPTTLTPEWRQEVGVGLASPLVQGDRVYVFARTDDQEKLRCLNKADGKPLWTYAYSAVFYGNSQAKSPKLFPGSEGRGPFATPLLHGPYLISVGVSKIVTCVRASDGQLVWQKALFQDKIPTRVQYVCPPCGSACCSKTFTAAGPCPDCRMELNAAGVETAAVEVGNYYGAAVSPLVDDDLLVVQLREGDHGVTLAMSVADGRERWRWQGSVPASASPIIATLLGTRQLIAVSRESLDGIDLKTGASLWQVAIPSNAQILTPIVFEDLVIYAEYRLPLKAVRLSRTQNGLIATLAWEAPDHPVVVTTPVRVGNDLFGLSSKKRGSFFVVDAKTGATRWQDPEGNRGLSASLLNLGSKLAALTSEGALTFWSNEGSVWTQHANYQVAKTPTWAHPVFDGKQLLVRDAYHLTSFRFP